MAVTGQGPGGGRFLAAGLISQILSGLSNALLTLIIARQVSPAHLGTFALAYGYVMIVNGIVRAGNLEDYLAGSVTDDRYLVGVATRSALHGLIAAVPALALTLLWVDEPFGAALVLGALPVVALQEAFRAGLVKGARVADAMFLEVAWLAVMAPFVAFALWRDSTSLAAFTASWVAGGVCSALLGMRWFGFFRAPIANRGLAPFRAAYALEYLGASGAPYALIFLAGSIISIEAAGILRVLQTVFGVITMPLIGITSAQMAFFAKRRGDLSTVHVLVPAVAFAFFPLMVWKAVIEPLSLVLATLFGSSIAEALQVGGLMALYMAGVGAFSAVVPMFRIAGASRASLTLRTGTTAGVAAGFALGARYGLSEALIGASAAAAAAALIWVTKAQRLLPGIRRMKT